MNPWVFTTTVRTPFDPKEYTRRIEQITEKALKLKERASTHQDWAVMANYRRLCSGKNLQTKAEKHGLKCYYNAPSEYWLIGPLKTELHYLEPRVVQIYGFIPVTITNEMMIRAKPGLDRSRVISAIAKTVKLILRKYIW